MRWRVSYLGLGKPMGRLFRSNRCSLHTRLLFGIVSFDCGELVGSSVTDLAWEAEELPTVYSAVSGST